MVCAAAGGAAMTLYLINMRVSMLAFMGTFAWFFFILNFLKVPILLGLGFLTAETLRADLLFIPVVVAGALIGIPVFRRMDERVFTNIALALSAVAATNLIGAFWGTAVAKTIYSGYIDMAGGHIAIEGMQLAIACGLLHAPSVLFFDEPLTGLDPLGIRRRRGGRRRRHDDAACECSVAR